MTNEITLFKNENYNLQVMEIDREPWFFAKEIAECLGLKSPWKTIGELKSSYKKNMNLTLSKFRKKGDNGKRVLINEPGFYTLALRSRKPEAVKFREWVVEEVIPSIRKKGYYMPPEVLTGIEDRVRAGVLNELRPAIEGMMQDNQHLINLADKQMGDVNYSMKALDNSMLQVKEALVKKGLHPIRVMKVEDTPENRRLYRKNLGLYGNYIKKTESEVKEMVYDIIFSTDPVTMSDFKKQVYNIKRKFKLNHYSQTDHLVRLGMFSEAFKTIAILVKQYKDNISRQNFIDSRKMFD